MFSTLVPGNLNILDKELVAFRVFSLR